MATAAGQGAEALGGGRLESAHRALVADGSIQFDLPALARPPKPPAWLEAIAAFFRWLAPAFPYMFWGAIIIAVLIAVYFVIRNSYGFEWLRHRHRSEAETETEHWLPDEGIARALLAEAEGLAAQGRYAEAARLLLHRSVEDIARLLPQFLKPSLTARDIAGADALPGAARPAFAAIANVVEVSAFGSRAVTAEAWADCRVAYARFATPATWARTPARG